MVGAAFTFFLLALGLRALWHELSTWVRFSDGRRELRSLGEVSSLLHELQETLASGVVPEASRWQALRALAPPWGLLAHESLSELRAQGGALLPTMKRLRELADEHRVSLLEARARATSALGQAMACAVLVPISGSALFLLLPGVEDHPYSWLLACGLSALLAGLGAAWMLTMADSARWGGLSTERRPWVLAAQCAGERFLALVRAGTPADLAWGQATTFLEREAVGLAAAWGRSVWVGGPEATAHLSGAARSLASTGENLRKAVQVSLMEGRPCTERAEAALLGLRAELRAQVERELAALGSRALQPLFFCVAPALLTLLGFGLWLAWSSVAV